MAVIPGSEHSRLFLVYLSYLVTCGVLLLALWHLGVTGVPFVGAAVVVALGVASAFEPAFAWLERCSRTERVVSA